MAEFPAMPLWTDAYLADCGHLDDAEHGRYFLIMVHLWRSPKQRFPNDDLWLARKFRRSVDAVKTQIRPLINEFCLCDGNWIYQKRVTKEFAYVSSHSEKQRARAKLRWDKEKDICHGNAASGNAPTPTPTPHIKRDTSVSPKKSPASILSPLLGIEVAAAVIEHRQRLRKPMTTRAAELMLREFGKCSDPVAGAELMIERGWQGFKAEWFDNQTANGKGKGNERLNGIMRMADRLDGRAKADGEMDCGESAGDAVAFLPARHAAGD